jgi:hypothetical protein
MNFLTSKRAHLWAVSTAHTHNNLLIDGTQCLTVILYVFRSLTVHDTDVIDEI